VAYEKIISSGGQIGQVICGWRLTNCYIMCYLWVCL